MRRGGDGEGGGVAGDDGSLCGGRGACQWVVGGPEEEYDCVQYPEYAEKVEEYCSWGQKRVKHLYWYWRQ